MIRFFVYYTAMPLEKFPSHLFNVIICNDFVCNDIALLLHQRARMERLAKQLKLEKEELDRLKAEVNGMEHDLMQRRLRRVSCTTAIPTVSHLLECVQRKVKTWILPAIIHFGSVSDRYLVLFFEIG